MVYIAHLTNGGKALAIDAAQLSGGQAHQRIAVFLSHKLGSNPGTAH
jgi:hypothetical protein